MIELLIEDSELFIPEVEEGISWQTDRQGNPGTLKFSVPRENIGRFEEGAHVALRVDGKGMFYGFVFTKKSGGQSDMVEVTAYDQLRYFKNKDTYVYEDKTAGELIRMLAADFQLQAGEIEDTGFRIASRVEENSTLFDIVQNALDLTLTNTGQLYVLYDDYGKLALKNIANMALNFLVEPSSGEDYSYTSSIDSDTYNKIKLSYENSEAGTRDIYITQDSSHMNKWGVLQYYDTLQEGENGAAKAEALLSLYNQPTRSLTFSNLFGDINVRAGSLIVVKMDLGDVQLENLMLVEKCKHVFYNDVHYMDLTVRGGEFIA
ncbi:MAG: hydrolase [Eubacteriales bacterium]|nr:hydrolase [Eubacteriales bacterium]